MPRSERRTFTLGQVLSVTTGKLLCPIGEVYEILNFLTADSLFTHQLPRASRECEPYLLQCFPQLRNVDSSGVMPGNWREWLATQVDIFGPTLELESMPDGHHEYRDDLVELEEMVGPDRVIVVAPAEREGGQDAGV